MHSHPVDAFLKAFLKPPAGNSPQDIKARLLHWIEVANHPENFSEDKNPIVLSAKRRSARQCLKRLAIRHPDIAADLMSERQKQSGVQ